jgi:quercetin dioxygenase-like cupin family protein
MPDTSSQYPPLPPDDLTRALTFAQHDDEDLPHIGMVGDTYTITVSGQDTGGKFCVIDMHVPPGGGPGPHRHDFEETFILLDGEVEFTFRGLKSTARAGDTVNIPSNAPHRFHNVSASPARMLCICAPAGNDEFFLQAGVLVATRTTPPLPLDQQQMGEFIAKAKSLAPQFRTELLPPEQA